MKTTQRPSQQVTASFLGIVFLLLFAIVHPLHAEEDHIFKYQNNNLKLKPLSPEEEARLAPIKLGVPPTFSREELKKLNRREIVIRRIPTPDKPGLMYDAIAIIDHSPSDIMTFLRDYENRIGMMPHNTDIKVRWDKNLAIEDLTLKVAFYTIRYRLHLLHYGNSYIEWEYAHGDIKDTHGYYKLFPYLGGKGTLLIYHTYTDSGAPLPKFVLNMLTQSSLPEVIHVIRREVGPHLAKRRTKTVPQVDSETPRP